MRTIETKIYKLDEHPNKEKCFDWIKNNWHDLNQHSFDELIQSIKALSEEIGGDFDYSISQVPDRGEYITFKNYCHETLCRLSADDLPLTGCFWDAELIEGLRTGNLHKALDVLHSETEFIYSNEGLTELIEGNDYEFTEEGGVI